MYCLTCCLKYVSFYPVVYLKYLPSENVQSEKRRGNLYLKNTFYRVIQITLSNIFKLFHPALTNPKISFLESYPRLWNSSFFLGGGGVEGVRGGNQWMLPSSKDSTAEALLLLRRARTCELSISGSWLRSGADWTLLKVLSHRLFLAGIQSKYAICGMIKTRSHKQA